MPSTTALGYPIPLDSDPFCDNTKAVRNLGTAVNNGVGVIACGTATVPVTASGTGTVAITFPAGRFTAAPKVTATAVSATTYYAYASGKSSTGCTIGVRHFDNTSATTSITVDWIAVQQ